MAGLTIIIAPANQPKTEVKGERLSVHPYVGNEEFPTSLIFEGANGVNS